MVSEARPIETDGGKVTEVDFRNSNSRAVAPADMAYGSGRDIEVAGQYDDYAWQGAADGGPPRRSRLFTALASLVAIAGFVAVVWFAYQWGLERGYREEVPVVRAAAGPIKIKPENPGGLVVPNQDKLVLNQLTTSPTEPQVERLLSEPEAPQIPQVAEAPVVLPGDEQPEQDQAGLDSLVAAATEAAPDETQAGGATGEAGPTPEALGDIATAAGGATAGETEPAAATADPAAGAQETQTLIPRRRPEPPAAATQTAQATATPSATPTTSAAAGATATGTAGSGSASGSESGGGSTTGGSGTGGTGGSETAASAPGTQIVAVEKGDFVIQLASVTSAGAAKSEWSRLQKTFPVLLGDMNLAVQTATVKGTEYHRVQTGPFPSRATAVDLCLQLKAKSQPCLVQKRK